MLNQKNLNTKVLKSLKGIIVHKTFTGSNISVGSYGSASSNISFTAPTGYVLASVCSAQTNNSILAVYPIISNIGGASGTITCWCRNATNSTLTCSVSVGLLFIREDLFTAAT